MLTILAKLTAPLDAILGPLIGIGWTAAAVVAGVLTAVTFLCCLWTMRASMMQPFEGCSIRKEKRRILMVARKGGASGISWRVLSVSRGCPLW
ncbi:hypothetical protein [Jannaschia sp. 2305UL9-9]|uniref:hypothetical protein n=1 Tax=Jannaschia sp. 2305UL9-9 TaxID=3121638 RepID=UPI003527936F